jgi:hypothetical protein
LDDLVTPALHKDWIELKGPWFGALLQAYTRTVKEPKLSRCLACFLTYKAFTVDQAKMMIAKIPGFDPRKLSSPGSPLTFIDLAKDFNTPDMVEFLESLFPKQNDPEFNGIDELKNAGPRMSLAKGVLTKLDTPSKIHQFIGMHNPVVEGDQGFFPQEAAEKTIALFEALKATLAQEQIEVYGVESLSLDPIADGRKNIGIITLDGQRVVYKSMTTIYTSYWFSSAQRVADFIANTRKLKQNVPNVVEILPKIVLNREESIDVGYLMQLEPGKQLREIPQLSPEEKQSIQDQFNNAVETMLESGYALYDFNDDNVLWDGKKLTFIDLSPAGFDPETLHHADTADVILRMAAMLSRV